MRARGRRPRPDAAPRWPGARASRHRSSCAATPPIAVPLLLLLALGLAGCPRRPMAGGEALVVVTERGPSELDPRFALDAYSSRILDALLRGLVRIGPHGEVLPDVARRWRFETPTRWVFTLRPDVRFEDGTPLTPAVVVANLEAIRDPELGSPRRSAFATVAAVTHDAERVVLTLTEPTAPLLVALSFPLLHPAQVTRDRIERPLASGPFRLAAHRTGDLLLLRRRSRPGAPSRILLREIPDPLGRVFALETGEAALALNNVPVRELARLAALPHLAVDRRPGWNVSYLAFNCRHPALADARVRRAIALAIDRRAIARALLGDTVTLTESLLPPGHWAYAEALTPMVPDRAAARRLLDAAGWPDPPGPVPRLRLVYKTSTNPERLQIAQAIAADLARVGIAVEIRSLEFGTLFADIRKGNFDLYTLTWVGVVEPDLLHWALHSSSVPPNGANRGRCLDPVLDRYLDAGRRNLDPERRRTWYLRAQRRIHERLPILPLWAHDTIVVRHRDLLGFEPTPGGGWRALAAVRWRSPAQEAP